MRSIQNHILIALATLLSIATLILLSWTYYATHHEVEEVYDASLVQMARQFSGLLSATPDLTDLEPLSRTLQHAELTSAASNELDEEDEADYRGSNADDPGHHYEHKVGFQVWQQDGRLLLSVPYRLQLTAPNSPGFENLSERNAAWRTYTLYNPQRQLWIRALQPVNLRNEMAEEVSEHVLLPLISVLSILVIAIVIAVNRGLNPLKQIGRELDQRHSEDLTAINTSDLPRELRGPVDSLNRMFQRVEETLLRERRFTSDAAHELRTPLAALKIHLERLYPLAGDNRVLHQGLERMERVVAQLLVLARLEPKQGQQLPLTPIEPGALIGDVIAELVPFALRKQVQLALHPFADVELQADPTLLQVLIRNLLENAIRYTTDDDTVEVRLSSGPGHLSIQVIDHGPGLDDPLKQQVLQRFYRSDKSDSAGAGLGFSIVEQITQLHHGQLRLQDTPGGGLTVEVLLPLS